MSQAVLMFTGKRPEGTPVNRIGMGNSGRNINYCVLLGHISMIIHDLVNLNYMSFFSYVGGGGRGWGADKTCLSDSSWHIT